MTTPRDPDRSIHAFLMEGRTELADPVYDVVRSTIEHTQQRVVIGPWRLPQMNKLLVAGLSAAAVIAVLLVGPNLFRSSAPGPGGQPSASTEPSVAVTSPEPSEAPASAEPSRAPDGSLPEGPFVVTDSTAPVEPVTVTIPSSGWTAMPDYDGLMKGEDDDPPEAAILFWSWPTGTAFDVYGDPCKWESTRPETPASTPAEIADALAAQASRDASNPVDVTVAGYDGKHITLHVPNDAPTREEAFKDCDGGEFASYGVTGGAASVDGLERTHQGPGQVDELWILDVNGAIVIIDAMYRPDTSDELIEEMREIAESAVFE